MRARRAVRGQAATEYLLVLSLTTVVLVLTAMDPSPIQQLIDGIKSAYRAFSYAISFST